MQDYKYSYKGYSYSEDREYEEDNVKSMHSVYFNDTYCSHVPFSPYSSVGYSTFCAWIDMGMPTYNQMGGNTPKHHKSYYDKWLDNQIDRLLVQEMTDAL
jgi:hypothetical protein